MSTRRREKQGTKFQSVNGIGLGSVVVWGGVMAIATFASVTSALKFSRRRKAHPPSPPPLPPDFVHNSTELKQEASECFGKGLHDLVLNDLKGKEEPTTDVVGIMKEPDSRDHAVMRRNPIMEEEYHETNPDQEEKGEEQGKIISDSFEEETKRGACEEEVDEITMEEYRAAEDDSTEEEEEEEEEEEDDDNSESKRAASRIEGGQRMEEVKSESEKENQNEDEEEDETEEEEEDETEEEEEDETESEEAGDSSTSSNVEDMWPSESDKEMCVHLKSTHMGMTDDHKPLKRKARGNRIDDDDDDNLISEAMLGSSSNELLMKKNWSKLRIVIVIILAMALLLSLVNTLKSEEASFPKRQVFRRT